MKIARNLCIAAFLLLGGLQAQAQTVSAVLVSDGSGNASMSKTLPAGLSAATPLGSTEAAPTAAGTGGTCATGAIAGHTPVGTITLTGACAATNTLAITFPVAATIGYACNVVDRTLPAALVNETAITSTTITTLTFAGTTTGATDVLRFMCYPY